MIRPEGLFPEPERGRTCPSSRSPPNQSPASAGSDSETMPCFDKKPLTVAHPERKCGARLTQRESVTLLDNRIPGRNRVRLLFREGSHVTLRIQPESRFFHAFSTTRDFYPTQLRSRNGPFSFNESAAPERSRDGCFKQNGDPGPLPYEINPGAFRVIFYAAPWPSRKMP